MLAIEHVLPRDLTAVGVEQVLALKTKLADELDTFHTFIAAQLPELRRYAAIPADASRAEAFAHHLDTQLRGPLDRLDKSWRQLGYDTARTLLTVQSFTPPALLAATVPVLDAHPSSSASARSGSPSATPGGRPTPATGNRSPHPPSATSCRSDTP